MSPATVDEKKAIDLFIKTVGGEIAAELEACMHCGVCAEACQFYLTSGNPEYAPVWKVELLRKAYQQNFTIIGKVKTMLGLEKPISKEDIAHWSVLDFNACTVCRRCSLACPMGIDVGGLIAKVRAGLTAAGATPPDLLRMKDNQLEVGSPNGATEDDWRAWFEWAEKERGIKIPQDVKGADTLVVFTMLELGSFRENLVYVARILNAAGEKWTVSLRARDAFNMGKVIGDKKLEKLFAERIINVAKELGVKRVVITECGHGYAALREDMPNVYGGPLPFEIVHITELMNRFFKQGRIKLRKGAFDNGHRITFHDSCKIQRTGALFDEPRELLQYLAPNSFVEMNPNRDMTICCGGGGGVRAIKDAYELRMDAFKLKVDQVEKAQADTVVMTCSNCRLQFMDGFKHYELQKEAVGLVEMVAKALIE